MWISHVSEHGPWDMPLDICFLDEGILYWIAMFQGWPHKSTFPSSLVLSVDQLFFLLFLAQLPHISIIFSSFVKGHRFGKWGPYSFGRQGVIFQTLTGFPCWASSVACRSPHMPLHSTVFSEPRVPKHPGLTLTSGKPSWKSFFWNFCTSLYTFQITNEKYLGKKEKWTVLKSLL